LITQGFFEWGRSRRRRRSLAGALIVAALLLSVGALAWRSAFRRQPSRHAASPSPPTYADLTPLRASADAGDAGALSSLVAALHDQTSPEVQALVVEMLRSPRPEVRAAGCAWIGRQPRADLSALLVPRMSDADWRVRAAAFDALERTAGHLPGAPKAPAPLRDTPVNPREDVVFAWIHGLRSAGEAIPASLDHCELYAPAGGNWLTGTKLAQSCFACHAPPDTYAAADFVRCADCHGGAHGDWAGSSHARSTTHLNLLRVDDRTKQVALVNPGPREGLVCTSCHVPDTARNDTAPPIAGTESLVVPHRFKPGAAAASCATCHAETQTEWATWKVQPRPRVSTWLPGEFTWDEQPDERTCVSCHMHERPKPLAGLAHRFATRRDPTFMRGGLSARIEPATAQRGPQLVLTNLAGHRYPSGTIRRALRIELHYDTDAPDGKRLFTRLTDSTVPTTLPTQPPLAPGEQRRFDVPVPAGASRVTCSITYERNQFEPGSLEVPLHEITERVAAPIALGDGVGG
jgi:hypothetical protein